jgi:hypothetical protein
MQGIQVTTGYRGTRTNEQYITPGQYPADDPLLHGLGQFLIDSGRAHWCVLPDVPVDEEELGTSEIEVSDPAVVVLYQSMALAQLKKLVEERGLQVPAKATKADYAAALAQADELSQRRDDATNPAE